MLVFLSRPSALLFAPAFGRRAALEPVTALDGSKLERSTAFGAPLSLLSFFASLPHSESAEHPPLLRANSAVLAASGAH